MSEFDVERGFISCLLGGKDIATVRDNRITPRFFTGDNRPAYKYILDMSIKTGEIPTVRAFRREFPKYSLEEFEGKVGTEENIKYWIAELRRKVKQNSLADSVEDAANFLNDEKAEEALTALKKEIMYIESEVEETSDILLNENLDLRKKEYEKKQKTEGMMGIPTGLPFIDFMLKGLAPETLTTFIGTTGVGKAMPLDTPILTPNGFVPLRDIHAGSVVYDEDGKEATVLAEFPQKGRKQEYLVTFNDGTSVKCCKDHLWKYKTVYDIHRKDFDFWRVDTVENILSRYKSLTQGRKYLLSVPVCRAIEFPKKELLIPPYAMGALLGDGGFTQKQITFTNVEEDVKSKVFSQLSAFGEFYCSENMIQSHFKGGRGSNPFRDYIRETFNGCSSLHKFIPREYLMSDVEDRFELVRGLIDTDGHIDEKGHVYFSSSSRQLCDDFIFVVRSLGYRVSLHEYSREDRDNHEFIVRVKSDDNRLFTSIKHTTSYNNRKVGKKHHYELLKVVDIKPLDTFSDMKCILVDSPKHTFICKDFIVTHNTYFEILIGAYAALNGYRVLQCMTEMSVRQMRDRYEMILFGMTVGAINNNEFRSGKLSPDMRKKYFDFLDEIMPDIDLPMITAISPMQIEANIDKYNPDLVLIDGVYLMQDDEKAESDWLRIAHITRALKIIAKRKRVALMINSQADKNTSKKTGPELGDISFSQAIGQDCLPSETSILTDCGYKEIQNLQGEVFNVFDGEHYKKARCTYAGKKSMVTIIYRGNEFTCSPNHKLYVWDEEVADFVWKKAKDIEPFNDFLLEQNFEGEGGCEHIVRLEMNAGNNAKDITIPIDATYDLGMLIGMFIGDGSFKPFSKGQVTISCGHDYDYANLCLDLVKKYFNLEGSIALCKSSTSGKEELLATWYSVKLAQWFAFFCSDKSQEKTVKTGFCELNKPFRQGLIAGLIQSDGSCISQVEVVSSEFGVVRGANLILKTLGVCTRYDYNQNGYKGKHRVRLMTHDLPKLEANLVGQKKEQFNRLCNSHSCGRLAKPKNYITKMCNEVMKGLTDYNDKTFKSVALGCKTGMLSQKYLEKVSFQPYKFMQVEEVVDCHYETDMWDIQVFNADKRIIANGIVCHNSDNVLTAYRTPIMCTDKEMCIKILKGREGGTGKAMLSWDFSNMQFKEIYNEKDSGGSETIEAEDTSDEGAVNPYVEV